jgi:hypothetical protein
MKSKNQKWIVIGIIAVALVGLGFILYLNVRPQPAVKGAVQYPRPSRGHDNTIVFASDELPLPPAGGVHWDQWQNCGVYDEPVQTGNAIHSMEHGAVWIAYQPDLPAAEVEKLRERVNGETYLLLSPYPDLQSPIVLTSWGAQLEVDDADDGRIDEFIGRYRLGSLTPEPGAACDRGVGNPVDRAAQTSTETMDSQ